MRQRSCCVPDCTDKISRRYCIPTEKRVRLIWIERIGNPKLSDQEDQNYLRNFVVCANHFNDACKGCNRRLLKYSLPTIKCPNYNGPSTKEHSFSYPEEPLKPVTPEKVKDVLKAVAKWNTNIAATLQHEDDMSLNVLNKVLASEKTHSYQKPSTSTNICRSPSPSTDDVVFVPTQVPRVDVVARAPSPCNIRKSPTKNVTLKRPPRKRALLRLFGVTSDSQDTGAKRLRPNSENCEPQHTYEMPVLDISRSPSHNENQDTENTTDEEHDEDTNPINEMDKFMAPKYVDTDQAQKNINDSFSTLSQILQCQRVKKDDDCERYGKLLIKKLRKYPESMRQMIMHKIDGVLLENPCPDSHSSRSTPSDAIGSTPCPMEPYSHTNPVSSAAPQFPESSPQINREDNNKIQRKTIVILSHKVIKPSTSKNIIESAFIDAITEPH